MIRVITEVTAEFIRFNKNHVIGVAAEIVPINLQVPSFPNDIAMALIESELGKPWQEIYSELTESPIAAGTSLHDLFCFTFCSVLLVRVSSHAG